jgi:E3 ubiquitin-protein ligase DOA10
MSEQCTANVANEERSAMRATAAENNRELRKEAEELAEDSDDEVVAPQSKPVHSLDDAKLNSNDNIKKEAPK